MAVYVLHPWTAISRIVFPIDVFKAKRPNRRHLRDVLAGFCPMEMGRVAGKNDHGTGWIGMQSLSVELITNPDVDNTGNHVVHPMFGGLVWHQLDTTRYLDPDRVGSGL